MFLLLLTVCAAIFGADFTLINVEDRWRKGIVPYEVPSIQDVKYNGRNGLSSKFNGDQVKNINEAMEAIEAVTCVRFVPKKKSDTAFIYFRLPKPGECAPVAPQIGYSGVAQPVFVTQAIIRNLLYSLGLGDEHNRVDRDHFIEVLWQHIKKEYVIRFNIDNDTITYDLPYDYDSIMHPNTYFGINTKVYKKGVHTYKPHNIEYRHSTTFMRNKIVRTKMTCRDVRKINLHYDCKKQLRMEKKSRHLLNGTCPAIVTNSLTGNESHFMVYVQGDTIYKNKFLNVSEKQLVVNTQTKNMSVSIDCSFKRVYWFDRTAKQIVWASFSDDDDHTPTKILDFPTEVGAIALDRINDVMYLSDITRKAIVYIRLPSFQVDGQFKTVWYPQGITIGFGPGDIHYIFWYECRTPYDIDWFKKFQCRMWRTEIHGYHNPDTLFSNESTLIEVESNHYLVHFARNIHAAHKRIYTIFWGGIYSRDFNGKDKRFIPLLREEGTYIYQITSDKNWLYCIGSAWVYPDSYVRVFRNNISDVDSSMTLIFQQEDKLYMEYFGFGVC